MYHVTTLPATVVNWFYLLTERTASGKILKGELRKVARDAWEKKANNIPGPKL